MVPCPNGVWDWIITRCDFDPHYKIVTYANIGNEAKTFCPCMFMLKEDATNYSNTIYEIRNLKKALESITGKRILPWEGMTEYY